MYLKQEGRWAQIRKFAPSVTCLNSFRLRSRWCHLAELSYSIRPEELQGIKFQSDLHRSVAFWWNLDQCFHWSTLREKRELSEDRQWEENAFNEQGIINPYPDWESTSCLLTNSWWAHLFSFKCFCVFIFLVHGMNCRLETPLTLWSSWVFHSHNSGSGKRLHYHINKAWGKNSCWQPCFTMQSKGRKYVFILDWREKDTWQAARGFSCASAGPAGNYLCGCGSWLVCLTGGISGGLENRYGKFLKSQINT